MLADFMNNMDYILLDALAIHMNPGRIFFIDENCINQSKGYIGLLKTRPLNHFVGNVSLYKSLGLSCHRKSRKIWHDDKKMSKGHHPARFLVHER